MEMQVHSGRSGPFDFYGQHLLLTFFECEVDLDDADRIRDDIVAAVTSAGAKIVGHIEHKFDPCGLSVVLMLSTSHASVHTYPVYRSCFLDLFTCGREVRVHRFAEVLEQLWRPRRISKQVHERANPVSGISPPLIAAGR